MCQTLSEPVDYCPPGSSVHGILQARVLEWLAISFSRGSSQHRDQTWIKGLTKIKNHLVKESEVAQSCPTLCDPVDYSLPRSFVRGIFQARVLEWGAIAFSENMCYYCYNCLELLLRVNDLRFTAIWRYWAALMEKPKKGQSYTSQNHGFWSRDSYSVTWGGGKAKLLKRSWDGRCVGKCFI